MAYYADRLSPNARVAIVDDHESVRRGLRAACIEAGFEVAAIAGTMPELRTTLRQQRVKVVVIDLSLGDGSSVTENVRMARTLGDAVLVHSVADRVALVREALAAGAAGVIPKSSPTAEVISAIDLVASGTALTNLEWASVVEADPEFAKAQLGRRERDVLHLYASGLPLKVVAMQLGVTYSTAKEYLDRIRVKYIEVGRPAKTKVDLLKRAVEDGILPGVDIETPDGA